MAAKQDLSAPLLNHAVESPPTTTEGAVPRRRPAPVPVLTRSDEHLSQHKFACAAFPTLQAMLLLRHNCWVGLDDLTQHQHAAHT